jgi:uncharacterized repeat protein (TIGR01451 family)
VVREINRPPALVPIPNQTVAEGGTLALLIRGSDPDLPSNKLSYTLVSGARGATLDSESGLLLWSPSPGQGANVFSVRVNDNASPSLSDTRSFKVTVIQSLPADLLVWSNPASASIELGAPLRYSLVVSNRGPVVATGVVLTDETPQGTSFVQATTTRGSFTRAADSVVFSLGRLEPGSSAVLSLTILPQMSGSVSNRVFLTAAEPDPDLGNNVLEQHTTVLEAAPTDLHLVIDGRQLVLFWPSPATGLVLESTDDLNQTRGWGLVSSNAVLEGNQFVLKLAAASAQKFYRLARSSSQSKPGVSITKSGGGLVLSWPDSGSSYTLESSDAFSSGSNWKPVPGVPSSIGGQIKFTVPLTAPQKFYRLRSGAVSILP